MDLINRIEKFVQEQSRNPGPRAIALNAAILSLQWILATWDSGSSDSEVAEAIETVSCGGETSTHRYIQNLINSTGRAPSSSDLAAEGAQIIMRDLKIVPIEKDDY